MILGEIIYFQPIEKPMASKHLQNKKNLIANTTRINTYARLVHHLVLILRIHKDSSGHKQVVRCKTHTEDSSCEQVLHHLQT
jgi:hypothetical protein